MLYLFIKKKKFYFPLPEEWLNILIDNNIRVNYGLSKFLFYISTIFYLFKDILKIVGFVFSKQKNVNKNNTIIYLNNLPEIDFEQKFFTPKYNFLLWLKEYFKIKNDITFIHNNKKFLIKFCTISR